MQTSDMRWWIILAAMVLGGVVVLRGDMDDSVTADSAMEIWGDVVRDVDQCGATLIRVSEQEEMRLGRELASSMVEGEAPPSPWDAYVDGVGRSLVRNVRRRGIDYDFHVIPSEETNAFALPGGQVFITTGMLEFLESEAELACVLGHEIAHVDQRHAIERLHTQISMKRIGMDEIGAVAGFPRMLVRMGYRKYQELEADVTGLRLATAAGYDAEAAVAPFIRMVGAMGRPRRSRPANPLDESLLAIAGAVGSYFDTHPASADRIVRLEHLIAHRRAWASPDSRAYVGVRNHREKVPRATREFADEFTAVH